MIIDTNGLIASKTWAGNIDCGDSLAETGRIYFLKSLCTIVDELQPFKRALICLKNSKGEWIRNPTSYTDPKDVSRDQLDPMIMCLSINGYEEDTKNEFRNIVTNWFRYPNGDLCSAEHTAHFYRGQNRPWLRGLFYIGDLFTLLNTLIICVSGYSYVANDLNHIISLCFAEKFYPTFISRLAAIIYLKNRDYVKALSLYYTESSGNSDLVRYYLSGLFWLRDRL